jgi:hypothetical protein
MSENWRGGRGAQNGSEDKPMRFSIRDLLWATVVVAMGLGWWVSDRAMEARWFRVSQQAHRLRANLLLAKRFREKLPEPVSPSVWLLGDKVDWSIVNEPLGEP